MILLAKGYFQGKEITINDVLNFDSFRIWWHTPNDRFEGCVHNKSVNEGHLFITSKAEGEYLKHIEMIREECENE